MAKPDEIYIPTQILQDLFSNINDILFVNDSYSCLSGKEIRELLAACGAKDTLRITERDNPERLKSLDLPDSTSSEGLQDHFILRLEEILTSLDKEIDCGKSQLLWKALTALNPADFKAVYKYYYYKPRSEHYDADFLVKLKAGKWITNKEGELKKPEQASFSSLERTPEKEWRTKLLDMIPETISIEQHSEKMAEKDGEISQLTSENNQKDEEISQLKSQLEKEKSPCLTATTESQGNFEPECPANEAEPQTYTARSERPEKNGSTERRSSVDSDYSRKEQSDEENQRSFPESSKEIGKYGEKVVYTQLCDEYGEENITWHNANSETGNSYDMSIREGGIETFIEVKSTASIKFPHVFDVSSSQHETICENYEIHTVIGCGMLTPKIIKVKQPKNRI